MMNLSVTCITIVLFFQIINGEYTTNNFRLSSIVPSTNSRLISSNNDAELISNSNNNNGDLQPAATERFFDLSSLFNRNVYGRPYYPQGGGGGYYPQGGGGGYYPQGQYPITPYGGGGGVGGYPVAGGGGYPVAGGGGYGTNVLGAGGYGGYGGYGGGGVGGGVGGYGGYGGFGGNGGLTAYNGYYNNQYHGNRNLGFGYYKGTDSNGFYRSNVEPLNSISGYRGYSY